MKLGDSVTVLKNQISEEPGIIVEISSRFIKVRWGDKIGIYSDVESVIPA